jgi:hydroxymethylglutaryl-CoA reductase (NADPH)
LRLRWSHRNHIAAIRQRRRTLEALPGFTAEDRRIFPDPAADAILHQYQEAYVGQMVLPVGIVGPMSVSLGEYRHAEPDGRLEEVGRTTEKIIIPLGHTEGGLSASMLRGIHATSLAGGIHTAVLQDEMTRDSALVFDDVGTALRVREWVIRHEAELKAWLNDPGNPGYKERLPNGRTRLSSHAHLWSIEPRLIGPVVHLLYRFSTGDACGPNIITRNAFVLNEEIARRLSLEGLEPRQMYLEANMGGDKKPSWEHFPGGHGKTVVAWAVLPDDVVRRVLRVEPQALQQLEWTGLHGAHASGMQSFAFTPASAVAALFVVTGQDLGMVGTSSMAQATVSRSERGLVFSIRFSGIEVGTVGGGASLPHAQTYLRMMGCLRPGGARRLAQIIAAASLALEISASASMASRASENFFQAHWERGGLRGQSSSPH